MTEQQIQTAITNQQMSVMKLVHHRTLERFTGGPAVDRSRLFFLLLPQLNGDSWSPEIGTAAKTVSIVHAALQAHDRVHEQGNMTKEQQLTVLAGDYYSGIYYQLLAKLDSILLIRQLSSTIAKISEGKALFYTEGRPSLEEIDASMRTIESGLIRSFYEFHGYGHYSELADAALASLRYEEELALLRDGRYSTVLSVITAACGSRLQTEQWLEEKVNAMTGTAIAIVRQLPLAYELKNFLISQVLPQQYKVEQLTREG